MTTLTERIKTLEAERTIVQTQRNECIESDESVNHFSGCENCDIKSGRECSIIDKIQALTSLKTSLLKEVEKLRGEVEEATKAEKTITMWEKQAIIKWIQDELIGAEK